MRGAAPVYKASHAVMAVVRPVVLARCSLNLFLHRIILIVISNQFTNTSITAHIILIIIKSNTASKLSKREKCSFLLNIRTCKGNSNICVLYSIFFFGTIPLNRFF